ncbi:DegT/DnrJ/EryC1/StrS family aminotransferase [Methylobacterium sp. A54F]
MIPFLDLKAQYAAIGPEIEAAVIETLRSGEFILGSSVSAFEAAWAEACGARHAVAVSSGTAALQLALLALGVGPGDEVITVSATFVATAAAVLYTGATPVLVDVDPATWTMDPALVEAAITPRTKAIMPVHLHGRLADVAALGAIAARHGIPLVEDAAQAHLAERDGRRAGTFGAIGCFSFYPGKNLGACGEGGAIVTDRDDLAEAVRCLRDWGQRGKYNHVMHGFNLRMEGVQGAALGVKLPYLEGWTRARQRVGAAYAAGLAGLPLDLPAPGGRDHAYHVYAVGTDDREGLRDGLARAGVATGIHYPVPVHRQPAYADLGYGPGSLPVTERLAARTLSLPMFPEMTDAQVARVCEAVTKLCEVSDAQAA